jgi:hypothetical protein
MAEMSEVSKLAVDFLFGDRSVFASEEEFSAFVRQYGEKLSTATAALGVQG